MRNANVIIFGAGGQVGKALTRAASDYGFHPIALGSADADITDPARLAELAKEFPLAPVINAAAYTAVDKAETEVDAAFAINAVAPATIAALFADRPIIHYSTDYVFSGEGETPFSPEDETAPLGVYGLSKRVGELAILKAPQGFVLRTAWVYGTDGNNFLKTMIRVGRQRGALNVVDDQHGTPTHADDIAQASFALLAAHRAGATEAMPGLYHLTGNGQTTWHGFAAEIFVALEKQTGEAIGLTAIPSTAYPTPAKRPAFSVLDCSKIDNVPGVERPQWETRVAATVKAVLDAEKASS
ncbi:dTDP-4-dehydrorhamnose reductase [Parvularcula sp. LCG005]|uniref:dTDP-4-dehydrorhamnose reductase n=1 Tax=Parvularcula sp. LCG005 TaxID=3078805 RepID=UPI002942FFA7|nr:dTDP-4-dehydrorhamnose reductase [Parvularcula sp. LCG005]WOI53266.1 dTDP-4-dehydrorhamnose reductase [Parvularcula sp. LCG005]